jgi:ribosomal protein L18E
LEEDGYTPEDISGHLLHHGFLSEKVTLVALAFSH